MPENISITCATGQMLVEVLPEAGLMLNAACGGGGRCGKCTVKIADAPDGVADVCADP